MDLQHLEPHKVTDALGTATTWIYFAGDAIGETWANGNARVLGYDALERHTTTTDGVGPVESLAYARTTQTAHDDLRPAEYRGARRESEEIVDAVPS